MDNMKEFNDYETLGDARDEYLAHQEWELFEARSRPDSEMATTNEVQALLIEMWEELYAPARDEDYTEEDAFRDFISDQYEEFN